MPTEIVELNMTKTSQGQSTKSIKSIKVKSTTLKILMSIIISAAILISIFPIGNFITKGAYAEGLQKSLDEKRNYALAAFAAATGASIAVSLLPGDVGAAISEKLADIGGYFMIVTGAILLEKIVLAISGVLAFKFIIPLSLLLFLISIWLDKNSDEWQSRKRFIFMLAFKCFTFGIILFIAIPASLIISNTIEKRFLPNEISKVVEDINIEEEIDLEIKDEKSFWDIPGKIADAAKDLGGKVTQIAKRGLDKAQKSLETLINTLVTMVITTCIIPLLTIVGFGALIKFIWGLDAAVTGSVAFQKKKR
jgi:hypothetical protein